MQIVAHRINTIEELSVLPKNFGAEIDIRTFNNELVLQHDPFKNGESFEEWMKNFDHELLILNVKEEGLEVSITKLLEANRINNFFFLDQSFPFLLKTADRGIKNCAVRFSEFESIETAVSLAGKIDWVWVDRFTEAVIDFASYRRLKSAGFKLCFVSPELHGHATRIEATAYKEIILKNNIYPDAVCSKFPEIWR